MQSIVLIISAILAGMTYKRSKYVDSIIGKILGFKDFLDVTEER